MNDKKRNVAAPCGLYCGACMVYRANKRGDSEFLERLREQFIKWFSDADKWQRRPGMPPLSKGFDISQMQMEMQGEVSICCEGCLSDVLAPHCRNCGFRECAQERGLTNCSQCAEMPCQWVIDFNNDGIPHHSEVLTNLERQKEIGIDAWLAEQEERWRCVQCGSPLAWYDAECPDCRVIQDQTFKSSPFSK